MSRLRWYVRRLGTMEPREVAWRVRNAAVNSVPSGVNRAVHNELTTSSGADDWQQAIVAFRSADGRPVLLDGGRARDIAARSPELASAVLDAANLVVERNFQFLGYPSVRLPDPIDWNYDPISRWHWPEQPARRINHRTAHADVKWIWELNRLQHLPLLAQAWLLSGDDRYSAAAFDHLDSWIASNPPGRGIAWRGGFEAGMRAISVAVAVQGLRDAPDFTMERFRRTVHLLAESAHRCWNDRSLHSSANNHLVGEMAGLAIVALMLPELRNARVWEKRAIQMLSREAGNQILADGSGAEQAVGYQMFTIELIHLVAVLMAQRDGNAPGPLVAAIRRSSDYLAALVGDKDPDPRYGDDDGGFALRLGTERTRTVRDHLGIVASSGWAGVPLSVVSQTMDSHWFGAASSVAEEGHASASNAAPAGTGFYAPAGGLTVIRRGESTLTMDVGPLGYLSIAAHGHADALAITLSRSGEAVISDPGTSSYYGHPDWRSVMRSTRAHPTVCVDGESQSVPGGPFLWSQRAQVKVHRADLEAGIIDAEHAGYRRLDGRVVHRRWLVAPPTERIHVVLDLITGDGVHQCSQHWPLHPGIEVEPRLSGHALNRGGLPVAVLSYAASAPLTLEAVRGDDTHQLGWWSDRLESRVPAWWLSASCQALLPVAIATLIVPEGATRAEDPSITLDGEIIKTTWIEAGARRELAVTVDGAVDLV